MADMIDFGTIDKRTEKYEIRIPEITKIKIERLNPYFKNLLVHRILEVMDRVLYEADYKPGTNLKSD